MTTNTQCDYSLVFHSVLESHSLGRSWQGSLGSSAREQEEGAYGVAFSLGLSACLGSCCTDMALGLAMVLEQMSFQL